MKKSLELSIIIPTYNESENIKPLFNRIAKALANTEYEIIFVDDNSMDGTIDKIKEITSKHNNIKLIIRKNKQGLSSAILKGFESAQGQIIAVMDADLQHPPELLPKMFKKIKEGYDIVIASRYIKGGKIEKWNFNRKIVSKAAALITRITIPKARKIKDPLSGFFMLKKQVIENADINPIGFKILLEIITKGEYRKITEIPYTFEPRRRGKSKFSTKEIINFLTQLIRLIF